MDRILGVVAAALAPAAFSYAYLDYARTSSTYSDAGVGGAVLPSLAIYLCVAVLYSVCVLNIARAADGRRSLIAGLAVAALAGTTAYAARGVSLVGLNIAFVICSAFVAAAVSRSLTIDSSPTNSNPTDA